MQVWFSTQLDLSAKRALLRVGRRLKKEVVTGWAGNSLKITDGLQVSDAEVSSEVIVRSQSTYTGLCKRVVPRLCELSPHGQRGC